MLARMNFGLMFGRFALDVEHNAIWFDETLLGEEFTDEGLRFAVRVVALTADEWDDRFKRQFGGVTYQEALAQGAAVNAPPVKPGRGAGALSMRRAQPGSFGPSTGRDAERFDPTSYRMISARGSRA